MALSTRTAGIAIAIVAVAGCGSDDAAAPTGPARDVAIEAFEYGFRSDAAITIEAGDTIRFNVENTGTIAHELEVLTDASRRLGKTEPIPAGASDQVTVTFAEPGVYTVICDIDDHRSRGQQAQFEVTEAAEDESS